MKETLEYFHSLGLKEDIYLEAKTESTGKFPPPNDRQDVSLEIMVLGSEAVEAQQLLIENNLLL